MLEWWNRKSILAKLVIVIVAACALLIATVSIRSCVIHSRDERFDKQEQQHAEERDALQAEKERAIGRAQQLEKEAEDLKIQIQILQMAATAAGTKAAEIAERLKDEDAKFEEQMRSVDAPAEYCERVKRICAIARRLYPSRPESQECRDCAAKSQ